MLNQSQFNEIGMNYQNRQSDCFLKEFTYKVAKGMGVTLGNLLRRTLFSQVSGYAIRNLVVTGVNHEFASITGLKESVQELIMNLRKVVFKGDANSAIAHLDIEKTGEVFASDILVSGLNVVNDHQYICTLDSAHLKIEMNIEKGVGIILARDVNVQDFQIDSIVCDAFFNPIEHVNYSVEDIENNLKEEILNISILTNGSISPYDAIDFAVDSCRVELSKISDRFMVPVNEEIPLKQLRVVSEALSYKIVDVQGMPTRILNCIKTLNITYVGELVKFTQRELLEKPNFGENSLNQLVDLLTNMGLHLGMDTSNWVQPVDETSEDMIIR